MTNPIQSPPETPADLPPDHEQAALAPSAPFDAPRIKLVEVLSQDVTPQVDAAARQLIASGDALLVKHSRNAVHGFVLDRDHFDTRVEWSATELHAVCPCETRAGGFVCPHLWATILLADRSGAFRPLEEGHVHPIFFRATAAAPDAAKRPASAWPARAGWRIHLTSIGQASARRVADGGATAQGLPRQAVYVVDTGETQATSALATAPAGGPAVIVELQSRYLKKNRPRAGAANGSGNWTRSVAFRLDAHDMETFTEPEDREILARIVGAPIDESPAALQAAAAAPATFKGCALRGMLGIDLLKRMCGTGRCRLRPAIPHRLAPAPDDLVRLQWDDGPLYEFIVRIAPHDDGKHFTLSGHLRRGSTVLPAAAARLMAEPAPAQAGGGLVFIEDRVARADLAGGLQWMELFASRGALHVPRADIQEFLRQVASLPVIPRFELPEDFKLEQSVGTPKPRLIVRRPVRGMIGTKSDERILSTLLFDYDSGAIDALAPAAGAYDPSSGKLVLRDRPAEAKALAILKALGFRKQVDPDSGETHFELPPRLLPSVVPALIREGWVVEAEGKLYRAATDFRVSVTSGIDWFDLSGSVQFGDQVVPLPRLLAAARKGEHLIKLADGTFGVLPEEWLAKYGVIVQSGSAVKDDDGKEAIRFSHAQAGMLDVLLESQPQASVDATFQNLRDQLREFGGVTAQNAPDSFVGTLRPYQQEGLGWFEFLRKFRFGGCLADDMGLGKTIQVLALLAGRRTGANGPTTELKDTSNSALSPQSSALSPPSIVVAPRSLIFNWREEAARFSPTLRLLDHTGPGRLRTTDHFPQYDLIITTYGTLRSDITFLKDFHFDYAILDEAQAIKNAQTESAKSVRLLQADHRLALSGTPVQNHLGELWSLFEYLNPGMLGASGVFDARFQPPAKLPKPVSTTSDVEPTEQPPAEPSSSEEPLSAQPSALSPPEEEDEPDESPRQLLSRALRPFILRRTKDQVAQDLPPCTEQTIYCELDESQRTLYEELRNHYRQSLLGASVKAPGVSGASAPNRMQVLEALLRLRQAACHPGLIDKTRVGEPSAKLDTLLTQIEEVLAENHKALVFSQFTSLLAIVRKRLDDRQVRYAYLDGKTRDRKSPVEQFQNDPGTRLFLISLKAGGLGLNLTGADYVFLLDPWWNPAVEAQAIDRAHRIGQTRHVFAYRLIAKGTVEEKVLQLQQTKRDLADAIISEDNALLSSLTSDDLQILLS